LNNKANGSIVVLIGVLFIFAAFAVMLVTFSGVMDQALHLDILPAMQKYIIGAVIAIILLVIGILILFFGSR
jgi:hypothetical protein